MCPSERERGRREFYLPLNISDYGAKIDELILCLEYVQFLLSVFSLIANLADPPLWHKCSSSLPLAAWLSTQTFRLIFSCHAMNHSLGQNSVCFSPISVTGWWNEPFTETSIQWNLVYTVNSPTFPENDFLLVCLYACFCMTDFCFQLLLGTRTTTNLQLTSLEMKLSSAFVTAAVLGGSLLLSRDSTQTKEK